MHTRQSGAAHVPMMFFLILLIMFLGALGFAYVSQDQATILREKLAAVNKDNEPQRGKNLLLTHLVEDLNGVIEKGGSYAGRSESVDSYFGQSLADIKGVMSPADIRQVLTAFCSAVGVSEARGLENVLGAAATKVAALNQRVKDIESELAKVRGEKSEVDAKFARATAEATTRGNEYKTTTDQIRADFVSATDAQKSQIASLQQNLRDKVDQMQAAADAATAREKALNVEKANLEGHNSALIAREALHNAPDVADGKVLVARTGVPIAYINLGRKDMLRAGTTFRVRNPHTNQVKAYATVTDVAQEQAAVELSGVVDPVGDAVREGDLLFSEIYSPRVVRNIYLMGRFTYPHNKPELQMLLENLGNKVVSKMGPGIDTVILGDDSINEAGDGFTKVEESAEYKTALDLRVEFVPLKKISDLIKL
ncbi:MAG: hypothetical protein IPK26_30515 [Planctomycetes bacterium]|nr:hypothetical protein [Planctomycetota bacterium]